MPDDDEIPNMNDESVRRLRAYVQGPGLARRIAHYLGTRGEDARRAAITDLVEWTRLIGQIGFRDDPPPLAEVARRVRCLLPDDEDVEVDDALWDAARDLTRDAVLNARRSRTPDLVVTAFLFGPATIPPDLARSAGQEFQLPDPLAARIATIDAAIAGYTSVEVSWALRLGVILNADQALGACLSRLDDIGQADDPMRTLRYVHADVAPIASALRAAMVWRPAVPTTLVHLMIVHIIDTWITHESDVFADDTFERTVEQAEGAMEEREASLRWLDRIEEWVTRIPDL